MIVEKTKVSKSSNVRTAALLTSVPLKTSPQTPCRENSSKNYYFLSTLLPTKKKRKAQIIAASEYLHALPIITIPSMPCFLQSYSMALYQACVVVVHIVVKTLSFPAFFLKKVFIESTTAISLLAFDSQRCDFPPYPVALSRRKAWKSSSAHSGGGISTSDCLRVAETQPSLCDEKNYGRRKKTSLFRFACHTIEQNTLRG